MIDSRYVLRLILIITLILLPLISAYADDSSTANNSVNNSSSFFGEIGLTPHIDTVSGNRTKFYEYADPTPYGGIHSDIRLGYDSDNYWLKIKAWDLGYGTQEYHVNGGMYGKFSYDLYFTDMLHNISLGAKTFYNNPGSNNLTYAPGSTVFQDPTASTWNSFDYSIKREKLGGNFDVAMLRPFYVDFSASRERITGINTGADDGFELPVPINYTSDTAKGEIGYQAKPVFASISYLYNSFDNQNKTLSNADTTGSTLMMALPPDNNYYKLSFKGSAQLPMDSRFNVTASTAKATSTFNLDSLLNSNYGTTSV